MFLPAFIFPGLGITELIVILAIVLIIFGPRKLPELGKAVGSTLRELRKSSKEDEPKDEDEAKVESTQKEDAPTAT